ncbi:MAG: DUF1127 domain-containing protein [Pseudomonadota bacterium]
MSAFVLSTFARPFATLRPNTIWRSLVTAMQVAKERRALANLDDRTLADIGLNHLQASREASRPIWDLPVGR